MKKYIVGRAMGKSGSFTDIHGKEIMGEKLTFKKLKEAIKVIRENSCIPKAKIEYDWGWVKFEGFSPVEIGLNKEAQEAIKKFCKFGEHCKKKGKIIKFHGLPVVVTENLEDLDE